MGKRPSFQNYPGDWLRDNVAGCSLAAQGLWLRMMYIGHDSERYGYLQWNGKPIPQESIARMCGAASLDEYLALLSELFAAGVPSRTPKGVIFSRRMVKDESIRNQTKERVQQFREKCNARVTVRYEDEVEEEVKTLEVSTKVKSFIRPTVEEVSSYCKESCNSVDPQHFLDYYESNGWRVGRNPMKSWKAAVRNWAKNGFTQPATWRKGNGEIPQKGACSRHPGSGLTVSGKCYACYIEQCSSQPGGTAAAQRMG